MNENLLFNANYNVKSILKDMDEVQEIGEVSTVLNEDLYFNPTCPIPNSIAMRRCRSGNKESYFIKFSVDDGTSNTKREEYEYKCHSLNFEMKTKLTVEEGIKITTERYKFLATVCDSIIEFACDFSTYEYKGKVAKDSMLECELKSGNDLALWCLTKNLEKYGFVETNKSRQTRAKEKFQFI